MKGIDNMLNFFRNEGQNIQWISNFISPFNQLFKCLELEVHKRFLSKIHIKQIVRIS